MKLFRNSEDTIDLVKRLQLIEIQLSNWILGFLS